MLERNCHLQSEGPSGQKKKKKRGRLMFSSKRALERSKMSVMDRRRGREEGGCCILANEILIVIGRVRLNIRHVVSSIWCHTYLHFCVS